MAATARLVAALSGQFLRLLLFDTVPALLRRRRVAVAAGRRARVALVGLGPAYARLAQLLASHAAVVPGSMLAGFDDGPEPRPRAVPARTVRDIVERELGPMGERFATFDDKPIGITPLAQVHGATLLSGARVAVKVRRPGLESLDQTLAFSLYAMAVARLLPKGVAVDRTALVASAADSYAAELDFRTEAAHLEEVAGGLDDALTTLVLPKLVVGMVTERVLVTELLVGVPVGDATSRGAVLASLNDAADALLRGAASGGAFHGDLRPANLLALPNGRLGIVDFGDCIRLDGDEREGLSRLLDATSRRDARAQLHALDLLGAVNPDVDRRALLARLAWAEDNGGDLWAIDPLHGVPRLLALLWDSGVEVPVPLLRLAESLLQLEAAAGSLGGRLTLAPCVAGFRRRGRRRKDPYGEPVTASEIAAAETAAGEAQREAPSFRDLARVIPEGLKPSRSNLANFAPIIVFLPLNIAFGLSWAILGLTVVLGGAQLQRKLTGRDQSKLLWFFFFFIVIRGAFGILLDSQVAYFGPQFIIPALMTIAFLGSAVVGRPLLGILAQYVWPQAPSVRDHPSMLRTFGLLTLGWGLLRVAETAAQLWVLTHSSASTYVVFRTASGQLQAPLFIGMLWLMKRTVTRAPELEQRILASAPA